MDNIIGGRSAVIQVTFLMEDRGFCKDVFATVEKPTRYYNRIFENYTGEVATWYSASPSIFESDCRISSQTIFEVVYQGRLCARDGNGDFEGKIPFVPFFEFERREAIRCSKKLPNLKGYEQMKEKLLSLPGGEQYSIHGACQDNWIYALNFGKETVQVYFQSPYTDYDKANGIEKAAAELCGFAKTDVLAPGASEDVTITVKKSELRTYDANNAKTYILDAGDYYFTAATDSHNAVNNILAAKGYTVAGTNGRMTEDGDTSLVWKWTNEALDATTYAASANGTAITNLFDESDPNKSSDAPGSVTWMSRSDWTGTVPTQPAALTANETLAADLAFTQYDGTEADSVEMPTLGAKNGLTLASMIGKGFDDPQWETLLDQLTFDEMVNTITLGFHNTAAAASIGKTATKDENGPQGLTAALTGGASAMCYTSEDVMAATFNVDLINEVGKCIGEDCLAMGYSGLYGPGINMHRTAYSGRNFEYYAEDPFVAGTICAAEVQGIQSKGVYVYLKHVALNDSETSRRGVNTWLNEQTAREIYLEVADKAITDGGAWCVMTGFNRWGATWCGANSNLLNGFLREELGMRGMCITDFSGSSQYMDLVDGLIAGSDIWDSPMPKIHTTKAANYENDAYIVTQMRNAMHHILYTVVNSNAMNGWSASDTLKTVLPWWQTAIYALIAVLAVLTVLCAWQLSKALKRKKELADTAPAVDQK